MVKYEITASGPKGYQVTATGLVGQSAVVSDFYSEAEALAFVEQMGRIDAGQSHGPTVAGGL